MARVQFDRIVAYAILLASATAVALPWWPGAMSNDTFATYYSMKFGPITSTQAWLIEWIWRPFFNAGFGPGYVLTLTLLGIALGSYLCLRGVFGRVGAAVGTAFVMLNPITYGPINAISRDNWYLAFVLLAAGGLVRLARADLTYRGWWRAFTVAALFFACAARQNGVFAVLPLTIALFWIESLGDGAAGRWGGLELRRAARSVLMGLLVTLAMVGTLFAGQRALGIEKTNPEIFLYVYDLAGVTEMTGEMQFSKAAYPAQNVDLIHQTSVYGRRALMFGSPDRIAFPMSEEQYTAIRDDWRRMIREHPFQYAKYRVKALAFQLGLKGEQIWVYHPQIDPNDLGMAFRFPGLEAKAKAYASVLSDENNNGMFLHRAWIYVLAALLAMLVILRSAIATARQKTAYLAHALTTFTMQIGLLMATLEIEIRYERQIRVSAMIVVITAGALLWRQLRAHHADGRQLVADDVPAQPGSV